MASDDPSYAPTFKEHEQAGWESRAVVYDRYTGSITRKTVQPLLDAARVRAGTRVLDIATGLGYVAGAAAARGAFAVGVDFASAMVIEARKRFPGAQFGEGDAEALAFDDGAFDAAICAFGLLHLTEPERAIAEVFRVLRPRGRYAFTVWCAPDKHEFFALVLGAIKSHGSLDVPLPPAPPIFRFSDPGECERALTAAGFVETEARELPLVWEPTSPGEVLDFIYKGTVRTALMLERQTPDALQRIHQAVLDGARRFQRGDAFRFAFPALLAAATKAP